MNCSFDFDGTLDQAEVQDYAKGLIQRGYNVMIVTQRPPTMFKDVFNTAKKLGLEQCSIVFCGSRDKAGVLSEKEYAFHLDNKLVECKNFVMYDKNFKTNCEKLL